jgi:hypothetical protein
MGNNGEFEKWARGECLPLKKSRDGDYENWETQLAWAGYKISQAEVYARKVKAGELMEENAVIKEQVATWRNRTEFWQDKYNKLAEAYNLEAKKTR